MIVFYDVICAQSISFILCSKTSSANSLINLFLPALPIFSLRLPSSISFSRQEAKVLSSPAFAIKPVNPSSTMSGTPPIDVVTTGKQFSMASRRTSGKQSFIVGRTKIFEFLSISCFATPYFRPWYMQTLILPPPRCTNPVHDLKHVSLKFLLGKRLFQLLITICTHSLA